MGRVYSLLSTLRYTPFPRMSAGHNATQGERGVGGKADRQPAEQGSYRYCLEATFPFRWASLTSWVSPYFRGFVLSSSTPRSSRIGQILLANSVPKRTLDILAIGSPGHWDLMTRWHSVLLKEPAGICWMMRSATSTRRSAPFLPSSPAGGVLTPAGRVRRVPFVRGSPASLAWGALIPTGRVRREPLD